MKGSSHKPMAIKPLPPEHLAGGDDFTKSINQKQQWSLLA